MQMFISSSFSSSTAIMTRLLVVIVLVAVITATTAERTKKNILRAIIQADPKLHLCAAAMNNREEGQEQQPADWVCYLEKEAQEQRPGGSSYQVEEARG